jgi:NADH dehydrogenase
MLLGGAFTFLASGASLLLLGMFLTSTGLYLDNWWMLLAAVACMGGAGRAFGMDYYLPTWYCRVWEHRQKNGGLKLIFGRDRK